MNADYPATSRIHSLGELFEHVEQICRQFSYVVWFRGHADAGTNWALRPAVHRVFPSADYEAALAMNFARRAPTRYPKCPDKDDLAGWLGLMQHYGLPTRLLDWTESILVAAYFAVHESKRESDAAIWALAPARLNQTMGLPHIPALSNPELVPYLRPAFGAEGAGAGTIATLYDESDIRMFVQQGTFTVHADCVALEENPGSKNFLHKFVIPQAAKSKMEWQLRLSGISQSRLFPDLQNLAAESLDQQIRVLKNKTNPL